MNLLEVEMALKVARSKGATDGTPVWAVSKAMDYSRKTKRIEYQCNAPWSQLDKPIVIEITE